MFEFFEKNPEIFAIMSEKSDGSMKVLPEGKVAKQNRINREKFFRKNKIDPNSVVIADLVHGNNVEIVTENGPRMISRADGLVTKQNGCFLAVTIADCVPIFFYEKKAEIFGIAHASWKGVLGNIATNVVEKISELGGDVDNLLVSMGPAIGQCHFEIKSDVSEKFANYHEYVLNVDGKMFVDLKGIISYQLAGAGIKSENIENYQLCTHCDEKCFSFRRDKPGIVEAMVAFIGLGNNINAD